MGSKRKYMYLTFGFIRMNYAIERENKLFQFKDYPAKKKIYIYMYTILFIVPCHWRIIFNSRGKSYYKYIYIIIYTSIRVGSFSVRMDIFWLSVFEKFLNEKSNSDTIDYTHAHTSHTFSFVYREHNII